MRLLFEMSIDAYYISKHLDNIDGIAKQLDDINTKKSGNYKYSHRDFSKDSSELRIINETGKKTGTMERIEYACSKGNKDLLDFYNELNASCHFNYFNIVVEFNKISDKEHLNSLFYLLTFYSMCFDNVVNAIGDILNDEKLKYYKSELMSKQINDKFELIKNGIDVQYS